MDLYCTRQEIHPLLVDHILDKIFHYSERNETFNFRRFRLVCHGWNQASCKALQVNSKEVITFGKFFHSISSMKDFLNLMQTSITFPYNNYQLCQDVFQSQNETLILKFFTLCNPSLSSLVIRFDHESTLQFDPKQLTNLCFPRLKTFVLDDRRNLHEISETVLLQAIIGASPNLETFSFHQQLQHNLFGIQNPINPPTERYLKDIIETIPLYTLKHLQLDIPFSDQVFSYLKTRMIQGNSIQNISLCLRTSHFNSNSLYDFLECFKENLKKLKIGGICKKSNFEIKFPKLENLECLEIQGWSSISPDVKFSNFSLQRNFPNLQVLLLNTWLEEPSWYQFVRTEINNENSHDDIKRDNNQPWMNSLYRLKLPEELINPSFLNNSDLWFSLKSLELHLTEDSVPVIEKVFKSLIHLEELTLIQSSGQSRSMKNIDSLLSGLSSSVCRKLEKIQNLQECFDASTRSFKSGLTNLQNLKYLDISEVLRYQAYVTDVSGYLVFANMKKLEQLKITQSKMSFGCLNLLAKRYPKDIQSELENFQENSSNQTSKMILKSCSIV